MGGLPAALERRCSWRKIGSRIEIVSWLFTDPHHSCKTWLTAKNCFSKSMSMGSSVLEHPEASRFKPCLHGIRICKGSHRGEEILNQRETGPGSSIQYHYCQLNKSTPSKNICNLHLDGENHRVALIRIKGLHPTKKGAKLHCAVTWIRIWKVT